MHQGRLLPLSPSQKACLLTLKKHNFLWNPKNKERFLSMPSKALQNVGCITHNGNGDTDLLIVETAVESAWTSTTVLVGDDTELLVFLCYHASEDRYDLYFRPGAKENTRSARVWHGRMSKSSCARKFAEISFFFCTPSPDATQKHSTMELGSQQPWSNLRMHYTSKNKLTSSAVILLFPTLSLQVKSTDLYHFLVVNQG